MSPSIGRVDQEEIPDRFRQAQEMCEEMGVVPDWMRLSDAFPEKFATYCEHFIDYFPKLPYHIKTSYQFGWPQAKSRRTGRPLPLIDGNDWLNRTESVERHLDLEQWKLFTQYHDLNRGRQTEFFWLGLNMPKMTTFHAIDADNKGRIGWYGKGTPDHPMMPVMEMPLSHFVDLKTLYDSFPDRIWCITSETLGLDIVQRHRLQSTEQVHKRTKQRLHRIGLGSTEVHPMRGRCKRRLFGDHYRTITEKGLLTTWQDQLDYYLNPDNTPSFRQIAMTLLSGLEEQWRSWLTDQNHQRNRQIDVVAKVEEQREIARRVKIWLDGGCQDLTTKTFAVGNEARNELSNQKSKTRNRPQTRSDFDLSLLRGGNWAKELEKIARNGLSADDSAGEVVFEFAKWFWWVELFAIPEEERQGLVLGLLRKFVTEKHNGFISRWNQGNREDVLAQVSRCLTSAIALNVRERDKSLQQFRTLRHKRDSGQYKKLIMLEPTILGISTPEDSSSSFSLSTLFSVCGLDDPLPEELVWQINERKGRNKIKSYAETFVNVLYLARQDNNFVRMERRELCERLLGYYDPTRFAKYNRILLRSNVIDMDTYRAHTRCTGYRLTQEARQMMDRVKTISQSP